MLNESTPDLIAELAAIRAANKRIRRRSIEIQRELVRRHGHHELLNYEGCVARIGGPKEKIRIISAAAVPGSLMSLQPDQRLIQDFLARSGEAPPGVEIVERHSVVKIIDSNGDHLPNLLITIHRGEDGLAGADVTPTASGELDCKPWHGVNDGEDDYEDEDEDDYEDEDEDDYEDEDEDEEGEADRSNREEIFGADDDDDEWDWGGTFISGSDDPPD